ncbi:MAG: flippase-like domain-containing protein [Chloroflexi bacterium]|nr:flippase-like domain-containing protein [Chloroflexota bacterium]
MRKFIVVFILCLGGILVILSFSEIRDIAAGLQRANPWFLAIAVLLQGIWFVVLGLTFQSLYRLLGLGERLQRLALVAAASGFVSIVTASAGFGGLALFISDGKKRGLSPGKITVAGALYFLLDEAAFLCVLAVGIFLLVKHKNLSIEEVVASLILFSLASVIALLLYLSYRSSTALGNLLAKMARIVNRVFRPFIHREYLSEERAHSFAAEMGEGLGSLPRRPYSLLSPFVLSLANKALLMGILTSAFLSFNVPFTPGKIIAGFSIAYLFLIVSPTPSGIGVVEGVMTLALHSLNIEWGDAAVVTLAYRAVTFWLALALGALAFRTLHLERVIKVEDKLPTGDVTENLDSLARGTTDK